MTNLLMIKRLVDGDDWFGGRVEAACWVLGIDYTPDVLRYVASDPGVQAGVSLDEHMTIDSTGVSDEALIDAVQAFIDKDTSSG